MAAKATNSDVNLYDFIKQRFDSLEQQLENIKDEVNDANSRTNQIAIELASLQEWRRAVDAQRAEDRKEISGFSQFKWKLMGAAVAISVLIAIAEAVFFTYIL